MSVGFEFLGIQSTFQIYGSELSKFIARILFFHFADFSQKISTFPIPNSDFFPRNFLNLQIFKKKKKENFKF